MCASALPSYARSCSWIAPRFTVPYASVEITARRNTSCCCVETRDRGLCAGLSRYSDGCSAFGSPNSCHLCHPWLSSCFAELTGCGRVWVVELASCCFLGSSCFVASTFGSIPCLSGRSGHLDCMCACLTEHSYCSAALSAQDTCYASTNLAVRRSTHDFLRNFSTRVYGARQT